MIKAKQSQKVVQFAGVACNDPIPYVRVLCSVSVSVSVAGEKEKQKRPHQETEEARARRRGAFDLRGLPLEEIELGRARRRRRRTNSELGVNGGVRETKTPRNYSSRNV